MGDLGPIQKMLIGYPCRNIEETKDALRQVIQEITLLALGRAGFFSRAAFYGGTALRIFHGLERFSEDLDFSLTEPDSSFDLGVYLPFVRDELMSFGFDMDVEQRIKTGVTAIQSAFIKGGTLVNLVKITAATPPVPGVPQNAQLRIKLEIDTDPPAGAQYEIKYRLRPIAHSVRLYDKPSLFAGKMHALLCRNWKQRVKGRDFYDYVWYLANEIPVNLSHLESRMRQSGHWSGDVPLTVDAVLRLLDERLATINLEQAKDDVIPYIVDTRPLDVWSRDFFMGISQERLKSA
jgi:hypothetical protein